MSELIKQAQKALDEDNFEEYAKLQVEIRDKYLEEENRNMYKGCINMKKLYFIFNGDDCFFGSYPSYELALKWAKKKPILYSKNLFKIV